MKAKPFLIIIAFIAVLAIIYYMVIKKQATAQQAGTVTQAIPGQTGTGTYATVPTSLSDAAKATVITPDMSGIQKLLLLGLQNSNVTSGFHGPY